MSGHAFTNDRISSFQLYRFVIRPDPYPHLQEWEKRNGLSIDRPSFAACTQEYTVQNWGICSLHLSVYSQYMKNLASFVPSYMRCLDHAGDDAAKKICTFIVEKQPHHLLIKVKENDAYGYMSCQRWSYSSRAGRQHLLQAC